MFRFSLNFALKYNSDKLDITLCVFFPQTKAKEKKETEKKEGKYRKTAQWYPTSSINDIYTNIIEWNAL